MHLNVTFGEAGNDIGVHNTGRTKTGREKLKEFGQKPAPVLHSPPRNFEKN
jgi:hypothetical protein